MNEPNNEPNNETNTGQLGDASSVSEGIHLTGERTPVEKDEKTVKDDANDYMYLHTRRKRHQSSNTQKPYEESAADELVASTRASRGSHRRRSHTSHHHHHHHSSQHHHHHHHHHRSSRRKKKMKGWKKALLIIGSVLLSLILIIVGTLAILIFKGNQELFNSEDVKIITPDDVGANVTDNGKYIVYNGENYKLNENVTSFLFMGVDKRGIDDLTSDGLGGQADVIVMLAVDFDKNKTTMVAVPRDTVTDVAIYSLGGSYVGMKKQQICLAYAYGDGKDLSCENMVASVRRIFYNMPVSTYFALDLDGISELNDAVDGVDVTSPETVASFVEGQDYHLVGDESESFVRSRSMDRLDANLLRMQRQQIYTKSFMNKVIAQTKKDITVPVTLFNESAPYSCTNLNAAKVTALARQVVQGKGMDFEFKQIDCEIKQNPDDERALYYIKEKEFFELFLSVYYDKVTSIDDLTKK